MKYLLEAGFKRNSSWAPQEHSPLQIEELTIANDLPEEELQLLIIQIIHSIK